jgi:hypothetical protein
MGSEIIQSECVEMQFSVNGEYVGCPVSESLIL